MTYGIFLMQMLWFGFFRKIYFKNCTESFLSDVVICIVGGVVIEISYRLLERGGRYIVKKFEKV